MNSISSEASQRSAMLEACELTFSYDEQQPPALEGINVRVEQGSFVAVIGPNASGKTTFARHCNALLLPTSGTFSILGQLSSAEESSCLEVRQKVGLVFQNPDNQTLIGVVEEDVAFALCNLGLSSDDIENRVKEALAAVGMERYRTCSTQRLSYGQKQKVVLAGVLAMRPDCIVLDEATAMLDPLSKQEILDILKQLRSQHNITVVMITHNMDEALLADRVLVFSRGSIVLDGQPSTVFSQTDMLFELGLELPAVRQLCYELSKAGCPMPAEVGTFEECGELILQMLAKECCS